MKERSNGRFLPLIVLIGLVVVLTGVSPRPALLAQAFETARIRLNNGADLDAAAQLAYIGAAQPWRDTLWELAGHAAFRGGDTQLAIDYLEYAAASDLITPAGRLLLGDAYAQINDREAAFRHWEAAALAGISPAEIGERKLAIFQANHEDLQTIQTLQLLVSENPTQADWQYQLGLLLSAYDPDRAQNHLERARQHDPEYAEQVSILLEGLEDLDANEPALGLVSAGRALGLIDEWALAVIAFESAVRILPDYADAWAFLGEAYVRVGEDGQPFLEHALALDPNSLAAHLLLGLHHKRAGRAAQALIHLEQAAELDPRNPAIQAEIGSAHSDLGDFNQALSYFVAATEMAPGQAAFWHLLAGFSIENETQIETIALAAARQALLLDDQDVIALDLLGYGYYLIGDPASAQRFLQQALEIDPDYHPIYLHLALVHIQNSDFDLAQRRLEQTIDLAPLSIEAERAMRILESVITP
jgi:tetratricopeptide (TPR) repeat protein